MHTSICIVTAVSFITKIDVKISLIRSAIKENLSKLSMGKRLQTISQIWHGRRQSNEVGIIP